MKSAVRFALLVFAGLVILQSAWIITIPPFRGIDEFDHVFRAVGVADGQWVLTETTSGGRGLVVEIPQDVVDAAQAQCAWLEYTGRDNCYPISRAPSGDVGILTAAGKYHPAYYAVIGSAAKPFDGAGVDYAARAVSALVCAFGAAVAAGCLALAGAGRWTRFGFLVSFSPMLVYTISLPAPNGTEIIAALWVWAGLLGLLGPKQQPPAVRTGFLAVATAGAVVLVTARYLGPLWLLLIVAVCLLHARGVGTITLAWREIRAKLLVASLVVIMAVAGSAWWSFYSGLLAGSADQVETGYSVPDDYGLRPALWMLQMVAAFPLRGEVASPSVYAAYVLVLLPMLVWGVRSAAKKQRIALVVTIVAILLVPAALTLATIESHGSIWQGRYTLPLAVGAPILAGLAMDARSVGRREAPRLILLGIGILALAHASALVDVRARVDNAVSRQDGSWLNPHPVGLVSLTLLAVTLLAWGCQAHWRQSAGSWSEVTTGNEEGPVLVSEAGIARAATRNEDEVKGKATHRTRHQRE